MELSAWLFDVPRSERAQRVGEALAATGLAEPAGRLVKTCSGGMVRRLELAQDLVNALRLLVLDESTVGLDPIARSDVWDHNHPAARTDRDDGADDHASHGRSPTRGTRPG